MMRHIWSVLALDTIVDQRTNNVSLLNVIEEVRLPGVPNVTPVAIPLPMTLASLWEAEGSTPARGRARYSFRAPDGTVLRDPVECDVELVTQRIRTFVRVTGLVGVEGRNSFIVEVETTEGSWCEVADLPLVIAFQGAESASGAAAPAGEPLEA